MKTRLQKVMEAHGVTMTDIAKGLDKNFGGTIYEFISELIEKEDSLTKYSGIWVKRLAEICNCSADYLLGLSENMNPIG